MSDYIDDYEPFVKKLLKSESMRAIRQLLFLAFVIICLAGILYYGIGTAQQWNADFYGRSNQSAERP